MESLASRATAVAAAGGGLVLAGATALVAALRTAGKPLHPRGELVTAELRRYGARPPTGVAWLDEPGTDTVLVRRSRGVGLPAALPDVHGLALRVPNPDGTHGDLLLAMTGLGPWSRFLLTASRAPTGRPMTTLLPYRSPTGPLLLAALPVAESHFELACASPRGSWRPFADLHVDVETHHDPTVSFDPLRHTVPGLDNYSWHETLREPAYRTARASRRS